MASAAEQSSGGRSFHIAGTSRALRSGRRAGTARRDTGGTHVVRRRWRSLRRVSSRSGRTACSAGCCWSGLLTMSPSTGGVRCRTSDSSSVQVPSTAELQQYYSKRLQKSLEYLKCVYRAGTTTIRPRRPNMFRLATNRYAADRHRRFRANGTLLQAPAPSSAREPPHME